MENENWTNDGLFFQRIASDYARGGIFLAFPDGAWSAGAYGEALRLEELGRPIWEVTIHINTYILIVISELEIFAKTTAEVNNKRLDRMDTFLEPGKNLTMIYSNSFFQKVGAVEQIKFGIVWHFLLPT